MLIDEARLASRIAHPNVVPTLDVVSDAGEMLVVMEYVVGASLSLLCQRSREKRQPVPVGVGVSILAGALYGLHAAHEARSDTGELLGVVHRDVSPQNVLVGVDGVPRVADFGIAKAMGRLQTTREGQVKGKSSYMAPEQIRAGDVDRRTDVYAAAVVLWEVLAGQRLFAGESPAATMNAVFEKDVPRVSQLRPDVPPALDAIVARGLARAPAERFPTAREMAIALESAARVAPAREVGDWVQAQAADVLALRARKTAEIESSTGSFFVLEAPPARSNDAGVEVLTDPSHSVLIGARPRGRAGLSIVVLAVVAAAVIGGSVLWGSSRRAGSHGATVQSAPEPSAANAPQLRPDPIASSVPAVAPLPSTTAAVASSAPRAPSSPPPRPVVRPRSASSCDPPYTVDKDGTRHWKSGC
jgi:serine/threonine-protein kinase